MVVIINAQVTKKIRPRLPGVWDKALDLYRFPKSAKIHLRLIYLISHSSIGRKILKINLFIAGHFL